MSSAPQPLTSLMYAAAAVSSAAALAAAVQVMGEKKSEQSSTSSSSSRSSHASGGFFSSVLRLLGFEHSPRQIAYAKTCEALHARMAKLLREAESYADGIREVRGEAEAIVLAAAAAADGGGGGGGADGDGVGYDDEEGYVSAGGSRLSRLERTRGRLVELDEYLMRVQLQTDGVTEELQRILSAADGEGSSEGEKEAAREYRPTCKQLTARVQELLAEIDSIRRSLEDRG